MSGTSLNTTYAPEDDGYGGQHGYDIALRIGGSIDDPRVGFSLVRALLEGGFGSEWDKAFGAPEQIVEHMAAVTRDGEGLVLTAKEVNSQAAMMAISVCREAGLPYVVSIGRTGEDGYDTEKAWHPGMDEPVRLDRYEHDDHDARQTPLAVSSDVASKLTSLDQRTWFAEDVPYFPVKQVRFAP